MWSTTFWKGALERAVKTFLQALIAAGGADQFNLLSLDWRAVLGIAGSAAVLSLLTSVVSSPLGPVSVEGTPSLTEDRA